MPKHEGAPSIGRKVRAASAVALSVTASIVGFSGEVQAKTAGKPNASASSKAGRTALVGYDISDYQAGQALPKNAAFAIVGVNGTLPNNFNPAFSQQYKWAEASKGSTSQPKAAVYVHVANPGSVTPMVADWPKTGKNSFGECNHSNSVACADQYGINKAEADIKSIAPNSPKIMWWIDIEPNYSWTKNQAKNAAAIEGEVSTFEQAGGKVGLYFQDTELTPLIGTINSSSNLHNLPEWLLGATSLNGQFSAEANCALPSITGGKVEVAQIAHPTGIDQDIACSDYTMHT